MQFLLDIGTLLGHVVSKEGITVNLKNIRTIMEWEAPMSVDDIRSCMVLASYYRSFIRSFSHISYHITSLQRKCKKFEWREGCATSFEQLKKLLTNAPVLKITDLDKEFLVCTNSCKRDSWYVMNEVN